MKRKNTDQLLEMLIEDSQLYKDIKIPEEVEEKQRLIRSFMNIRMPKPLPNEMLSVQDTYLQEQLLLKGMVTPSEIPTMKEQYKSSHPFFEKLSIWQGDITRLSVKAIVNAANAQMLGCFIPGHKCIDNAIHSGAGMQLREECHRIMNRRRRKYGSQYEEPTGTATLTKAYNLPCDYVIHTVGPIVHGKLTQKHKDDLRNCYENIFQCCIENKITSIALCCISTGEFHFPKEEAAIIAVKETWNFLKKQEDFPIERIIFNVFTDKDKKIYEKVLEKCEKNF